MPTYEYVCTTCENQWEEIQKISEDPLKICPKCGKDTAKRQISAGNFILKGGGWYADLYSSTAKPKSGEGGKADGASSTGKSDGGSASKSEGDAKTKSEAPAKKTESSSGSSSGSSSSGSSSGGSTST